MQTRADDDDDDDEEGQCAGSIFPSTQMRFRPTPQGKMPSAAAAAQ